MHHEWFFSSKTQRLGWLPKKLQKCHKELKLREALFSRIFKVFITYFFFSFKFANVTRYLYKYIFFLFFFSPFFFCIWNIYKVSNDLEGHFCHPYLLQEVTLPSIFVWSCAFVCKYFSLLTIFTVQCTIYKVQYKVLST